MPPPSRGRSPTPRRRGRALGGDFTLDDVEREHIRRVLLRAGSLDDAARILGIDPSTLWRKRKRYDI